jgi:alanyl-tRNA synthetase
MQYLFYKVLMKYNRLGPREFSQLPTLVIDTGMGLERLSTVLNGLTSNYDTDLFSPLFEHIYMHSKQMGIPSYENCELNSDLAKAYRTLSDHMRSIVISISDGLLPSRNGLGGFLKYLILKCMNIAKDDFKSDNETDLLCRMVPVVVMTLQNAYPDLKEKVKYIQEVLN